MYRILKEQIPCKFGNKVVDWVPTPFGHGNCAMESLECRYEGDKDIPVEVECGIKCPVYSPALTKICPKHDEEYLEWCGACEADAFKDYAPR